MTQAAALIDITARVWGEVGGPADLLDFVTTSGPRTVLPSHFDVTGLATASVAVATLAAAEFLAARNDTRPLPVTVDSRRACAAFAAEGLFTPVGWDLPGAWDPIAGNYQTQDGWIRLHTNYAYHRAVVERLLGAVDRESVRAAVAGWKSEDLETAVVEAGGCAAAMRTRAEWLAFPAGIATAHAPLVTGLRADALARLGYDDSALAALNPALIVASLDAYGWDGPWRDRRGFDSLVQMSAGITAAGAEATGAGKPVPLPVQALDHGCGYLIAAAVGRALTRRLTESVVSRVRLSLVGTANLLWSLPRPGAAGEQPPMPEPGDFPLTGTHTAWGPARRVPLPGEIAGLDPQWRVEAGPLGRHQPTWAESQAI